MHHANHFYGHAHILARYAGLDSLNPPRIWGYLQHGWNILDGYAVGTYLVAGLPKFVWSESVRRRGWSMGRRDYYVIGAAWNYLLAMERLSSAASAPQRDGTLWYPFHGWEGQEVVGDHQRLVAQITEVEPGPVTVCLYWNEYLDERIRSVYANAGFRVITHGYRGLYYRDTDRSFLLKQLTELRRHRRVASNRLSSAILYGISVGCEAGVYGDPMILAQEHPSFGGPARIARLWPSMAGESIPARDAEEFAHDELGIDHVVSAAELRQLFRWPSPGRT